MEPIVYFKALSDETRIRLLNLLLNYELNVNEIVAVMGMGQSRISRHLKILSDSGLLASRRDGLWVFYSAAEEGDGKAFLDAVSHLILKDESLNDDLKSLERMIEEREDEKNRFFNSIASDWDSVKHEILGSIDMVSEIIPYIRKTDTIADLGCGTGELLYSLSKSAEKVIGVDKSPRMLDEARRRFSATGGDVDLRIGEIEHLPMRDREADLAVINMVLHHLPAPQNGISEACRVLKEGDRLIIVDLEKHTNEEMRKNYGHRWLGFSGVEMKGWLRDSGFSLEDQNQFDVKQGLKVNLFIAKKK